MFGKNVKGEIIQLGIFAYFRSLDSKNYAYFYNSKWESLENFHDKIDEAFDLLKKDYKDGNLDSHTRVNSLVLPVLEEQFNEIKNTINERKINPIQSSSNVNILGGLEKSFNVHVLGPVKREYCNKLSFKAKKMYDHYGSYDSHLRNTKEDIEYFGPFIIVQIQRMIEIYRESWDREGYIRPENFAYDVETACEKEY